MNSCLFSGLSWNCLWCSTIRTAVLLTLTCCYLMWAVTYMAQLHPLIGVFDYFLSVDSFSDGPHDSATEPHKSKLKE